MKKLSNTEFIGKCQAIYGDAYTYEDTQYRGSKEPVTIRCKVHGEFSKTPNLLISKQSGCPACGNARKGVLFKLGEDKVIQELAEKFPNYTPFKLVGVYENNTTKVEFNCGRHGTQVSKVSYLRGLSQDTPCPVCNVELSSLRRRVAQERFIVECSNIHNGKYVYTGTIYTTSDSKFKVVCPDHGEFEVEAMAHKLGSGCSKCYFESRKDSILPYSQWLERAIAVHGDNYTYAAETYTGTSAKLKMFCKEHGEFWQIGNYHISGSRCPTCASTNSKGQLELTDFLKSLGVDLLTDHRIGEGKLEVDCYLPDQNLAIEYDGLKWHSTQHRPSNYHSRKRQALEDKGIQLIRIFEDEWQYRNLQVKSLLRSRLGKLDAKLYARECSLVRLSNENARSFYEVNHIQGWKRTGLNLGLQYREELVAVMTFTQSLSERGTEAKDTWELARFASSVQVLGGASKLFKAMLDISKAQKVISYSDDRLFTGRMYGAIGFKLCTKVPPSYTYWKSGLKLRLHKSHFRHSKLPKLLGDRYNPNLTERENCEAAGYFQIYDCGLTKWVWQSKS